MFAKLLASAYKLSMTSPTKLNVRSDSLTRSYSPSDMVLARTFVAIRSCGRCFLFVQFSPYTPPGPLSETSSMVSTNCRSGAARITPPAEAAAIARPASGYCRECGSGMIIGEVGGAGPLSLLVR